MVPHGPVQSWMSSPNPLEKAVVVKRCGGG